VSQERAEWVHGERVVIRKGKEVTEAVWIPVIKLLRARTWRKTMSRDADGKGGYYRCNQCKLDFTVRTATIFERSHVPLHKWIYAMYLVVTARKGISSMQLAKEIGVTQKTGSMYFTQRLALND
jgi:hypothetical protein